MIGLWLTAALALAAPPALDQTITYTMAEMTTSPDALARATQVGSEFLIRGWFKWHQAPDFSRYRAVVDQAHAAGARFGGGITCSALYDGENGLAAEQVAAMATRGPDGQLVDAWGQKGIRHGSLSSPAYLDYLFRWCREQLDAGADYLFMDEINAALGSNEGFDDASLADFRQWLREFGPADQRARATDKFDYREFLRAGGWLNKPFDRANPLAPAFRSFRAWRDDRAWHALTDRIRAYAKEHGRTVLLSGNGLERYVDLQVLGVWGDWRVRHGQVDLAEEQLTRWRQLVRAGQTKAGGPVPVVFFHDWGFGNPPFPWLGVSTKERELWWRVRVPELYAAGARFAWPVLGPFGCDARADGTLDAMARQAAFYREHREVYTRGGFVGTAAAKTEAADLSLALWQGAAPGRLVLHVINRQVRDRQLTTRDGLVVRLPVALEPTAATAVSPDFDGPRAVAAKVADGVLELTLPPLEAYQVVRLTFAHAPDLSAVSQAARTPLSGRWEGGGRSDFRVLADGSLEHGDELNAFLQGLLHTDLRNPPTFAYEAAAPSELRLKVRAVALGGAQVQVRVDGAVVATVDLPDLDKSNDGNLPEYDRELSFPLPAGRHRATLDNVGADWATVSWLEFRGAFR